MTLPEINGLGEYTPYMNIKIHETVQQSMKESLGPVGKGV